MATVIIVRGLPGVGKTTWIEKNFGEEEPTICSADHYFMLGGTYQYDHSKIAEAQEECFNTFFDALEADTPFIIVNNVFHRLWNFTPYMKVARRFKYDCHIAHIYTRDPWESCLRNTHGVPEHKFKWLLEAWEGAPQGWGEKKYRSNQAWRP